MTADGGPITTAERYSRAIHSSDLSPSLGRGDVDSLIGAGWTREGLGALLYRTRVEFEVVRGSLVQLGVIIDQAEAAMRAERRSVEVGPTRVAQIRQQLEADARTTLLLVLVEMKTLRETVQAVGRFADRQATIFGARYRLQRPLTPPTVSQVAGRTVENWLDPSCPHCAGRGFHGGFGAPLVICKACGGSKRRDMRFHADQAAHEFGRYLFDALDTKAERAARDIARLQAHRTESRESAPEAQAALQQRLAELRSSDAQED